MRGPGSGRGGQGPGLDHSVGIRRINEIGREVQEGGLTFCVVATGYDHIYFHSLRNAHGWATTVGAVVLMLIIHF